MADIYTYIKNNFGIVVSDYIFNRDYINDPLKLIQNPINFGKKYEIMNKSDLEYLYSTLNISISMCSKMLNISSSALKQQLKHYGIKKISNKTNNTNGLNIIQNGSIRCIEKPLYNDIYDLYINQNMSIEELSSYYGVGISYMTKVLKEYKITKSNKQQYEKRKQKMLESHGVENVFQLDCVKEKARNTRRRKYKCDYYSQTREYKQHIKDIQNDIQVKQLITKTKNGTLGKSLSLEENIIYDKLISLYGTVLRQYRSDLYSYNCDFYIPEIDTYIEYNGFWMHGGEKYIGSDDQNSVLNLWESKNTEQYKRAIETWTVIDPIKRQTAKHNNLNYLEFFNMKQFNEWFEEIRKNPSK